MCGEETHLRVVIADGGGEPTSTDPVADHVDPLTEPGLNPENKPQAPMTIVSQRARRLNMEI